MVREPFYRKGTEHLVCYYQLPDRLLDGLFFYRTQGEKMKKILLFISAIFICGMAIGQTINIKWIVDGQQYGTPTTCEYSGDVRLPTPPTKYGYTFAGWEPGNYIFLEYIESTGTQYIDTGIIPTVNTITEVSFELTAIPDHTYATLLGAYKNQNDNSAGYALFLNNTIPIQARTGYYSNPNIKSDYNVDIGKYDIILKFNKLIVNNREFYPQTYNAWDNIYNTIYLFTLNSPDRLSGRNTAARIYFCQIYNNDILVRDFIPAKRVSDNAVGMYDLVSGNFFGNSGTGTFIAGPDVQ